ncbi:MAG TPA: Ig-like domain-containing protein [Candidatus Dormibacteraeota bacterium]|nr:Ig-like domain-containing protein [Candidatus Dormibacteraeota bacterium]
MSMHHDPELDDVLQDAELVYLADLLRSARRAEPPLDEAFRSELRRTLMQKAWESSEGREPWWRRLTGPPALAWVGAAAGVVLIASVVVFMSLQPGGQLVVSSPIADAPAVQLQQPILVKFSQPMDHQSTQAAVQITPATYVAFSWQENTLSVLPTSGNLAPNTQYQVTIGPSARTATGQTLSAPQVITFVTQPAAPPPAAPSPTASPTPRSQLPGEHQVASLPSGTTYTPQWSADSATVYFVGTDGALNSVAASGGNVKVLVPDGISSNPAIAPAGDRLAYIRSGKIEVLTLSTGATAELPAAKAVIVSWVKDKLFWATSAGVYKEGPNASSPLIPLPLDGAVESIAPDGAHAIYGEAHSLLLLDLATAKSTGLGSIGAQFLGWSPDGTRLIYSSANGNVVADSQGKTLATIPTGDPSWSSLDEILLGSDTDLSAVRPDAFGLAKLANGTYHTPVWAPNGTAFTFVRGGALWTASATPLPPEPPALDLASAAATSFMKARLAVQSDQAKTYLTDNGKQAYSNGGINLLITTDPVFSRFYILTGEMTGSGTTARVVVRLVLAHGKLNVSGYEETLTLQRDLSTGQFLIDQATAGPRRDLGKGPEVVGVEVTAASIKVTFDSDLKAETVQDGVILLDGKGRQVGAKASYAEKTATISGLELTPGAPYKLVALSTIRDVNDHRVASEYDLDLVGPAASSDHSGSVVPPAPKPSPSPTPTATPTLKPVATMSPAT